MEQTLPIHTFKSQCYQLSQQVAAHEFQLIITKHGKPLVRVIPYETNLGKGLNALKGTATWTDDLIEPIAATWNVNVL